jgi:hypothetical protein
VVRARSGARNERQQRRYRYRDGNTPITLFHARPPSYER